MHISQGTLPALFIQWYKIYHWLIQDSNRVLKCNVIKMKFLKLWDLSGYSEGTMPKRPICQK